MISDSYYWKESLLDCANRLKIYSKSVSLIEQDLVRIEQDVFISFYSIRKLMDTVKIKDSTRELKVKLSWSPNLKVVNLLNNHRIDQLYNLNEIGSEIRTLKFLCDQFVHSYIFGVVQDENLGVSSFYFTSDRDKDKKLFSIDVQDVIDILMLVGNDYPSELRMVRDAETGLIEKKGC